MEKKPESGKKRRRQAQLLKHAGDEVAFQLRAKTINICHILPTRFFALSAGLPRRPVRLVAGAHGRGFAE